MTGKNAGCKMRSSIEKIGLPVPVLSFPIKWKMAPTGIIPKKLFICTAMKVFNDLNNLPDFKNAVLTIGSFDGVHQGHQKIIEKVNQLARNIGGESVLITFHPHPRLVIYPKDDSLKLLTTIDEKVQLLEHYGVDNLVVVPFTIEFSQLTADEYIEKFLVGKFHPRYVVIGYDHRFGLGRRGDVNYLKWHGQREGFDVVTIEKQEVENIAVSSSKIRNALDRGDVAAANQLLNHRFTLTGTVVHGQNIGKNLGFPTANIDIPQKHKLIPPNGIYAVYVIHQKHRYGGMLYIGHRPTLREHHDRTIEVNIFNFNKNIYGDKLRLELVEFIRNDSEFESLEELKGQLEEDKEKTELILRTQSQVEEKKKMSATPNVAIVILNFNGREYLQRFLPSVLAGSYPNFEVYVADNGSTDGSLEFIRKHYRTVKCIDLGQNYGYAAGYNRALQQVGADYYVLLNSDVEVTPQWIEPIIELMERDPMVAACQPKVKSFEQKDQFEYAGAAGGWIDAFGYPFCRGRIFAHTEKDTGQYDNTQEIFWATGAALFIRAQLFHDIGGFDPDYFAHYEEIDLCWRLKRAGYKIMARPRSVVYHVGGGTLSYTTPFKTYLNFRNTLYTILKNEPRERLLWLLPLRLLFDGLAGLLFLSQGKFRHIRSIIKAHLTFFPNLKRTLQQRRHNEELINKVSIQPYPNLAGRYQGSIVWEYYARGKRSFRELG
jgi:riboflavin kinase/FMN adenylyltransferase